MQGPGPEKFPRLQVVFSAVYWMVVLLALIYAQSSTDAGVDRRFLTVLALLAAVFNLIYHHLLPERWLGSRRLLAMVVTSSAFTLILIDVTGSLTSPFFFPLLIVILVSCLGLSRSGAVALTASVSLAFLLRVFWRGELATVSSLLAAGLRVASLWVMAYLGAFLARELGRAEEISRNQEKDRRSLDSLGALRDVLSGSGQDLKTMLDAVVERLRFALGIPAAAVFLIEEEKQTLVLTAQQGLPFEIAHQLAVQSVAERERGLAARTASLREDLVLDDLIAHPLSDEIREDSLLSGLRSAASLPLVSRGRLVGVLQLFSEEIGFFKKGSLTPLAHLAAELALAIENNWLEEQEKKRKAELAVLRGAAQTITSTQTVDDAVRDTLEAIGRLGYPTGVVLLLDERRRELVIQPCPAIPREQWSHRIRVGEGITGMAAQSGEVVVVPDTARDARYVSRGRAGRSEIALPLKAKGRFIGVLDVEHERVDAFGEEDVRILSSFANQAAIAIDTARLYETERSRAAQLGAFREYTERIQSARTEPEVIAAVLHYLNRLVDPSQAVVYRPAASGDMLEVVQHVGEPGRCGNMAIIDEAARCIAFRSGKAFRFDGPADLPCPVKSTSDGARYYLCLPLVVAGTVTGVIHLDNHGEGHWREERAELARGFVDYAAPILQNIRYLEQLQQRAVQDELTGLYNRRFLEGHLQKQLAMATRYEQPLAVLMLDIDHFKLVNDRFGHDVGDFVLRSFALNLSRATRASDVVARWGGEEFIVVLPTTDGRSAQTLAEKIRRSVENLSFEDRVPGLEGITVSIGAAAYPEHGRTVEMLLKSADLALYRAKQGGRNRVEAAVF